MSCSTKQYRELSKQIASTKTGNAWVRGDARIQGFWDWLPEVKTSEFSNFRRTSSMFCATYHGCLAGT